MQLMKLLFKATVNVFIKDSLLKFMKIVNNSIVNFKVIFLIICCLENKI